MNKTYQVAEPITNTNPAVKADFTTSKIVERKIGKCTYIVSSSFKDGKEKDIVSTIARLVQSDNTVR